VRFLRPNVTFCAFLLGISFTAPSGLSAQESSVPYCGTEQLDLDLGPQGGSPRSRGHWLVIAIQNRGRSDCKVPPLSVGFPPDGPDIIDIIENVDYKDTSGPAVGFKDKSRRLAPGDEAHVLLAWSSVPVESSGIVVGDCRMHDTLTVYSDPLHPALEVRHLWVQNCGPIWRSSYRAGSYVPGEPVSDEWLQAVQLNNSDFPKEGVPEPMEIGAHATRGTKLWTLFDVQDLSGNPDSGYGGAFPLFLRTSPEVSWNCPFRRLRKREADGQTTIYLTHCENNHEDFEIGDGSKQIGFFNFEFGLVPERPGRVEYEAVSGLLQDGKPTLAKARLELAIRDPNRPMLPTIDTNTPICHVSQLRLTTPSIELEPYWDKTTTSPLWGEGRYDGRVFEVTNISDQSCMLGGMPDLKFLRPTWWATGGINPPVCRNCATPLFKPRESRWMELKHGASAHFMVALANTAFSRSCTGIGGMDMHLFGDTQTLRLPWEYVFCGEIAVTAWRSGKYDGDPMNVEYDRKEEEREKGWLLTEQLQLDTSKIACVDNTKRLSDLPPPGPECAKQEFEKRGRPLMSAAQNGIAYGFSSPQNGSTTVYMWLDNQTNESQTYSTCSTSNVINAVDVYDSAGRRLLSRQDQDKQKICAEHKEFSLEFLPMCTWTKMVIIAPHTMQVVDSNDLQSSYVLSPGRFFIVPAHVQRQTCESLSKTLEEARQVKPEKAIMMVIPEQ